MFSGSSRAARRGRPAVLADVLVVLGSVPAASAAATIEVNSKADSHAVSPARGTYADKKGRCTLRAALEVANATAAGTPVGIRCPPAPATLPWGRSRSSTTR